MILNPDKVPSSLEDAIATLREGLAEADITELRRATFDPAQLHFSVGMLIRNEWSLWDKETILVKWFKQKYDLDHADDISGIILDCLHRDVIGKPRRDSELAKRYIDHWKKQK
jgi:hypothetical protein